MCAERDPAKPDKNDNESRRRKDQRATAAILNQRNNEQSELPVKQRGADGVTAGKAVTRPIDEPAVNKWTMSMHQNFDPLVQEHPARDCHNHDQKRRPPAFENEKQDRDRKDDGNPLARAKFSNPPEHADECGRQMSMKPQGDIVIDTAEGVSDCKRGIHKSRAK